jgi:purine-binding chemotaxis protein CheW
MSTINQKALQQEKLEGQEIKDEAKKEVIENIDFKMVTFSLAGKDYGIDIMKVKEIAKDYDFTYVPNTAPYVRGVYNLRGDIISVIDLRIMFNLPVKKNQDDEPENMIILRLENNTIGVIVDSTNKVVGISSENIQPTHPLFGDINVKYISGVVEHENKLYIILDVERIFGEEEEAPEIEQKQPAPEPSGGYEKQAAATQKAAEPEEVQLNFIKETLATFRGYYVSPVNEEWVKRRLDEWRDIRGREGKDIQLKSAEEADEFLQTFYSSYTGQLFAKDYLEAVRQVLPQSGSNQISAWNPGCGKGYESYSIACLLKNTYPQARLKVWAHDNDLLSISSAPGVYFQKSDVPESMQQYLVEGKNGYQFSSEIKDSIYFEYHDILHQNPFPAVDLIVARDILSFLEESNQQKLIAEFSEKLKPHGVLILGDNEQLKEPGWQPVEGARVVAFHKETG